MKDLPVDPNVDESNEDRAERAAEALGEYLTQDDPEVATYALLTDLMHYCDREGFDFDELLEMAERHYAAEVIPA